MGNENRPPRAERAWVDQSGGLGENDSGKYRRQVIEAESENKEVAMRSVLRENGQGVELAVIAAPGVGDGALSAVDLAVTSVAHDL